MRKVIVRMAERSKALRSGRSPLLWAWVRIPLLTTSFWFFRHISFDRCFSQSVGTPMLKIAEWRSGSVLGP